MKDSVTPISTKHCLICKDGRKNQCLHWHIDPETSDIWVYCVGKCQRGYSIYQYANMSGLKLNEFLKGDFNFVETRPDIVNKMVLIQVTACTTMRGVKVSCFRTTSRTRTVEHR